MKSSRGEIMVVHTMKALNSPLVIPAILESIFFTCSTTCTPFSSCSSSSPELSDKPSQSSSSLSGFSTIGLILGFLVVGGSGLNCASK